VGNARSANTFWVESTSSSGDVNSFLNQKGVRVIGVSYQVDATTDSITLYDLGSNSASAGTKKLKLISATAKDSKQERFADAPLIFPNGLWVVVSGAPTATLILANQGSGSS
jgi:hypothetical protein